MREQYARLSPNKQVAKAIAGMASDGWGVELPMASPEIANAFLPTDINDDALSCR